MDSRSLDIRVTRASLEYALRLPTDGIQERGYLMKSMTGVLRQSIGYRDLRSRDFDPFVRELERRLDDPEYTCIIACDPHDPWLVLGFVLGLPGLLTALHVRGGYRGLGLATDLAELLGITHGVPFGIEFPTTDVMRESPSRSFPIGLMHNSNWSAVVTPWAPTTRERGETR